MSYNTDIHGVSVEFIQYAASSLNHNSRTLDGNNICPDTVMIAAVTPAAKSTNLIIRAKVSHYGISSFWRSSNPAPKEWTGVFSSKKKESPFIKESLCILYIICEIVHIAYDSELFCVIANYCVIIICKRRVK